MRHVRNGLWLAGWAVGLPAALRAINAWLDRVEA